MSHFAYQQDLEELRSDNGSKRLHALNILLEYSKIEDDQSVSPILLHSHQDLVKLISTGNDKEISLTIEILSNLSSHDLNNEFLTRQSDLLGALCDRLLLVDYDSIKSSLGIPEEKIPNLQQKTSGGLMGALSLLNMLRTCPFDDYVQKSEEESHKQEERVQILSIFHDMAANLYNSTYLFENSRVFPTSLRILFSAPRGRERVLATSLLMNFTEDAIIRDEILELLQTEYAESFEKYSESVTHFPSSKIEANNLNEAKRNLNLLRDYVRPGVEFYSTDDFPFCKILEEKYPVILKEFQALDLDNYVDWPEKYLCKKGWDVFPFYAFKNKIEVNCNKCPETTKILESIPGLTTAMFSKLEPRTHIRPHIGYYQYSNKILRAHLGIKVPKDTALVVNGKSMGWEEGKTFVFDDTFRHEAYNKSYEDRVVLLLDFLHECDDLQRNPDFMAASPNRDDDDALISADLIEALGEFVDPQNCKSSSTSSQ